MITDIEKIKSDYSLFKKDYLDFQNEVYNLVTDIKIEHEVDTHILSVNQRVNKENIVAVKDLDSILDNIKKRKESYNKYTSLPDIKDISGVRVTCYCKEDLDNFVRFLVNKLQQTTKYEKIEVDDKRENKSEKEEKSKKKELLYQAVHINFPKKILKGEKEFKIHCEVQLRTIMANAWADQSHKYNYKSLDTGESRTLSNSVSKILNGCEDLWSLVREKHIKENYKNGISKDLLKTENIKTENIKSDFNNIQIDKNNEWFKKNRKTASTGLKEINSNAFMEVKVVLPNYNYKNDIEKLSDSARKSTIETFGWPIGIYLDDGKDHRPKADLEGIHAEILYNNVTWFPGDKKRTSYDYWAIKKDGSFYMKQSLFEDLKNNKNIYFDVRITRITELFLYLRNLYSFLKIPNDEYFDVFVEYGGLKNRILTSGSSNRVLFKNYEIDEDDFVSPVIRTTISEIDSNIVEIVYQSTEPLFKLFDFFKLDKTVLKEIVINYVNGKIV